MCELPEDLKLSLDEYDRRWDERLQESYDVIALKSRALANSLKRCMQAARASGRFVYAYKFGMESSSVLSDDELCKHVSLEFETQDFADFREFVRLLRACSLHIDGAISGLVRDAYNASSSGARLLMVYHYALYQSKKLHPR